MPGVRGDGWRKLPAQIAALTGFEVISMGAIGSLGSRMRLTTSTLANTICHSSQGQYQRVAGRARTQRLLLGIDRLDPPRHEHHQALDSAPKPSVGNYQKP